ncbi:hypothetical protein F66182_6172 [Fusarium sp. NRRL 66182]|nr:hypothetical protein F66182_6172 [Fusarium sp. NRRL 66182]
MPMAPDPRRGRACDACHANKTKCDGGAKCTLCAKRGISCTYNHASKSSSGSKSPSSDVAASESRAASRSTARDFEYREAVASVAVNITPVIPQSSPREEVIVGLKRLANSLRTREIVIDSEPPIPALDQSWMQANFGEYFGRFHDIWPILHAPTCVQLEDPLAVSLSVVMISCWLKNPDEFGEAALEVHAALMEQFFQWISIPRPRYQIDKAWPIQTYQAIVLNIIFAFYTGVCSPVAPLLRSFADELYQNEKLVARASLLRGTLIVSMRELEFFNNDGAAYEQRLHYPGTFVPWLLTVRDRWKRLIVALFKIDVYLSSTHFQPPILFREEIDLTMPSTFTCWNAHGLNIFFKRIPLEPAERSNYKLSEVIANPSTPAKSLLLFEDFHLALCGLYPAIWNHTQIVRRSTEAGRPPHNSISSLAWQLETWKADVDRLNHQCFRSAETGAYPFIAYIGDYDDEPARAKAAALANIKCLTSECLMTYHLQGLQLYADTRIMNMMALASTLPMEHETRACMRVQKHHAQMAAWALSIEGRRALIHAMSVLLECEANLEANEPQTQSIDPIAYLAISTSALVVWAWLIFSEAPCSSEGSAGHSPAGELGAVRGHGGAAWYTSV